MNTVRKQILQAAKRAGKKGLSRRELLKKAKLTKKQQPFFSETVKRLTAGGELVEKKGRIYSAKQAGLHEAVVTRIHQTFGFARQLDNDQEIFIPGKFLNGALPGDKVQVRYIPARHEDGPEGEVVSVLEYGSGEFVGVVVSDHGRMAVLPDTFARFPIPVMKGKNTACQAGDKVLAKVVLRGLHHADHRCRVTERFGDSQNPAVCADAMLKISGVPQTFSDEALAQAQRLAARGILEEEFDNRLDLRSELVFTIDSADSKDLDDAVSLSRIGEDYQLGVHIADVSHYVRKGSALDREAFARGTSIYYADRVIPMLPEALSNGICSLNPGEDRLAFSALLTLSRSGELVDFDFRKTVIRSRVKGVYSEINRILSHQEEEQIARKYEGLSETLFLMEQLADILHQNRINRGTPEIETRESKILMDGDDVADIRPRTRGKSERMIEEFMLMANEAAAALGRRLDLPFVYRVHEPPEPEKADTLKEILHTLGMPVPKLKGEIQPGQLAAVLKQAQGGKYDMLINTYVLRTMSKAKYSDEPLGHFGLVLKDYAHFTSPIRRYPDLAIHRILSMVVSGRTADAVRRKYQKFASDSAVQATRTELRAVRAERDCEDCYKAAYMAKHLNEVFSGVISSVAGQGIYVELSNTVEGLVRTESLGDGYAFDGLLSMRNAQGKTYRVGDEVRIICIRADVNSGQIDFELAES